MSYPKYRFEIFNGDVHWYAYPLDQDKLKFTEAPEGENIFYRRKLTSKLVFVNDPRRAIQDFDEFYQIERAALQCSELKIKIHKACADGFELWYEGYFTTPMGFFDLDNCRFEVTPNVDDEYRCILENRKKEVNILEGTTEFDIQTPIDSNFEYFTARGVDPAAANASFNATCPTPTNVWKVLSYGYDGSGGAYYVGYREKVVTQCLNGVTVVPAGSGWVLLTDDCALNGTCTYVRQPLAILPVPNSDVVPGFCDDTDPLSPPAQVSMAVDIVAGSSDSVTVNDVKGWTRLCASGLFPSQATYEIEAPDNSTFQWLISGTTWSIFGLDTGKSILAQFEDSDDYVVTCTETTVEGDTIVHEINVHTCPYATGCHEEATFEIEGPTSICSNQQNVKFSIPEIYRLPVDPVFGTSVWGEVVANNPRFQVVSHDDYEIILNVKDITYSGSIGYAAIATGSCGQFSFLKSKIIDVTRTPVTDPIVGLSGNLLAIGATGCKYRVSDRDGSTFQWTVTGGTIMSGQGTHEITVNWGAVAGTYAITVKETMECGCDYTEIAECGPLGEPPIYWCTDGPVVTVPNARLLMECLEKIITEIGCANLTGDIVSDFFEWNYDGTAPGFVVGQNYVYGAENQYRNVMINQKSDVINPTASNPATKGLTTWEEMMDFMLEAYHVFWWIDTAGNVRLEHEKYITAMLGLDTTQARYEVYVRRMNRYNHLIEERPKLETFTWMEALSQDFVGVPIRYETLCVNQNENDNNKEHSVPRITTDISYIITNPSEISKEGFVVTACELRNSDFYVISDVGVLSTNVVANAPMSWANLHFYFHRWGRVLPTGYMNNELTSFYSFKPTIQQEPIYVPICCGDEWFPERMIKTELSGKIGGINGKLLSAEYELANETIKLVIGYSYANI